MIWVLLLYRVATCPRAMLCRLSACRAASSLNLSRRLAGTWARRSCALPLGLPVDPKDSLSCGERDNRGVGRTQATASPRGSEEPPSQPNCDFLCLFQRSG